ncbi:MAG: hypothetical protein PUJ61_10220, partial [Spirochaetia bacterium]|nr:hypothetical protein [Spirochaetia bacterium]
MNKIIALVLFCIINSYGVKFLNSVREYQVNPVKGYVPWRFTGAEMFVLLTLGCAMLAVAPYGLLLFRLLFWMIFVLIGILRNKSHLSLVAMLYGVYILWFIVGFSYTPVPLYGLRQLAKYCLPFLLVLFVPSV